MWLFKFAKKRAMIVPLLVLLIIDKSTGRLIDEEQIIQIDRSEPATYQTSTKFVSTTFDCSNIANGLSDFDMTSQKLTKVLGHLSPSYIRIGGTLGDRLFFSPDSVDTNKNMESTISDFTMTGTQWLQLTNLAQQANLDVIFQLNALIRLEDGSWDYSNPESLISFSNEHKLNVNWELGNEPDLFHAIYNQDVNATQLAKDFATLRSILDKYEMYASSFIAGPDMWDPQGSYITEFVKDTKGVIDAVTWHQYYLNGQTAQEEDFLKPDVFDYLASRIQTVKDITNSVDASSTPIWLGETSSAYRGGAANMSDTFLATFLWADKLGVSAKMGLDVVMRQTLFNDNYALIDHNYDPNPDWWFSVIYKKLVGTKVVPYTSTLSAEVRLYSHCAAAGGSTASVAVFGVNLASSTANVRIEGLFADENSVATIYAYELTADPLLSRTVYLNGEALHLTEDYDLPELVPKEISSGSSVTMPPYSIVFWVIPSTDVNACL